ncbi:MAG TPA: DUF507 family protein [Nitrospira sp.]|nr:DUF507 family protein [Nitrospira sp.]
MRLSKERVRHMAEALAARLVQEGHVAVTGTSKALTEMLDQTMTDELLVEDRLNSEVRQLLKAYERQIEAGQVDYQKMFTMIKQKLVRERGVIL